MKVVLDVVKIVVEMDQQMFNGVKDRFIMEYGCELSFYLSKQVVIVVNVYQCIVDEFVECIGFLVVEGYVENSDCFVKFVFVLFLIVVCIVMMVLMLFDKIGIVDFVFDVVFIFVLMFSLMVDKNVSCKDVLEEFKMFVGLSLVMLVVFVVNKVVNDFMECGVSGLLVGLIVMSVLNLMMLGLVGYVVVCGIEVFMSMSLLDMLNGLKSIGDCVFQMFVGE